MYFSIIFIHLVIQVKFSIADEETLSLKSSCSDLVLDSNTNQMIKSLSLYRDEVFLLYGNAKETSDVFLYNYWASQINMEKPLFGLFSEPKQPFKMGNNKKEFNTTVKHGKLNQFLPKIDEFIASNEIISMLRLNDQLVVIFLRSIFEHTNIVYLTYEWHGTNASKLLESGIVQASNNEASQSILLFHFNETKLVNKENISVYFISLNDPSYQMGTINIHNNRLQLFPTSTYSRFIGINGNMNTRLYLVEEREEGSKYPDFQPFSKKVSIGKWRALKFANYIYLLSGIHSGYVYYFKPDNLTRRDPNDSLVVPLGVMSYGRFFGCGVESGREPTFPPDTLIVHSLFVHSYIFYFLVILFATILLLCCIQQSCYGPALRRARRYPTINLKEVTRIIEDSPQMSLNLEQSLAYGYRRCRCFRMKYGHCRFESPADSVDDSSPTSTSSNTSKETNNSSSSS